MALECLVPVSTEVIEQNPACVTGGECRDGILLVYLDALRQDHGERLSWPKETFIHWGPTYTLDEVDAEKEVQVKPFLTRLKRLGLQIQTCSIDHRQALRHAIQAVDPQARIQYDDFPIIQHIWKKLWSDVRAHRKEVEARSQGVRTAWDRDQREALAKTLWEKRSRLFKSDERMSPEEKQPLVEIMEADPKVGQLRTFLKGVWHLVRDSRDAQEARDALEALKQLKLEPKAREDTGKVFSFLDEHFDLMITYLTHRDVHRHSLAESGMRVLRRLEVEHDGVRTPKGRENCLKIYQAVKYLGWSVHHPNLTLVG